MPRLLFLALLSLGFSVFAPAADVIVAGSDLLRAALQPLEGVTVGDSGRLHLRLDGTRAALTELRSGRAQVAIVAFAPGEPLPETEFRLVPLAHQVVVVVVNTANPVLQLNLAQLAGLFGEREALNLRSWGALGGTGVWADKAVALGIVTDDDSVAVDLFSHTVLNVPQLRTAVLAHPDVDDLLRKVRVDDAVIGLSPRPVASEAGVRVLSLAREADDVPFGPTPENVQTGDYPLRLPFYLAVRAEANPATVAALELLLSDATAEKFARAGFMPAPPSARMEARRALGRR